MTVTETMSDPASSLRALALSTLKSKRRKPATVQPALSVMTRPPPPPPRLRNDILQLDYGEDESSMVTQTTATPSQMETDPPTKRGTHIREEGEISDEEIRQKAAPTVPSPQADPALSSSQPSLTPTSSMSKTGGLSLLDRITDAPTLLPSEPSPPLLERISSPNITSTQSRAINNQQVRPNVHLNQSQYDTAKDVVLDLLGWGVSPEYLVKCGLSRELIYYIFTELNLRLPENLDTAGLLPYNPDTVKTFSFIEPEPSLREKFRKASMTSRSNTLGMSKPQQSGSVPPSPIAQGDLHDIEKLRRQELIARKAVQASRKSRKVNGVSFPTLVPSETVDDFLKTITPSSSDSVPPKSASADDMDVDQPSSSTPVDLPSPPTPQDEEIPGLSVRILDAPPSSSDMIMTTFNNVMRLSPEPMSSISTPVHHYPSRRGMKRPVASDFVDLDTNPQGIGSQNGTIHQPIRRKTGATSFMSVRPTKCVIDLSDSESDGEDMLNGPVRQNPPSARLDQPANSAPTSGIATPSTLEETEKEIQRMRMLIAQREQKNKLKRLGLKSDQSKSSANASTVVSSPSPSETPSQQKPIPISAPVPSQVVSTSPSFAVPSFNITRIAPLSNSMEPKLQAPSALPPNTPLMNAEPEVPAKSDQEVSPLNGSVDVDSTVSSSAQILEAPTTLYSGLSEIDAVSTEPGHENVMAHESLFTSYPLLRLSLQSSLAGTWSTLNRATKSDSVGSGLILSLPLPDLRPLREATLMKRLDPNQCLCQYEVPGGGVCRDAGCEDVHLSKLNDSPHLADPDDHDTAKYIVSVCEGFSLDLVFSKLQQVRMKMPNGSLEERVTQAMTCQQTSLPEPPPAT